MVAVRAVWAFEQLGEVEHGGWADCCNLPSLLSLVVAVYRNRTLYGVTTLTQCDDCGVKNGRRR